MIYSEPVTSTQPIPIQPSTFSSFSLPARAVALSERAVNTRRGTDAVVARLQELREASSSSSLMAVNASGSGTQMSDPDCDVFNCDLEFDDCASSDAENCRQMFAGGYQRQRRETFAKRSSIDSLLEHYDSESFSEEGSSNDSSDADEECEDCECGCNKNAYISRRFLRHKGNNAASPNRNQFNLYADNSDLEMMELDHEDLMPPANIRDVGDVIGYVNVVRAERQEALQRLEGLLSQIGETWQNKRNQFMPPQ
ncbi:hypothetical protein L596_020358 [Steinernema carpocapsae]|uniref:Uncharacterized protein n=1 Tax=Steinernema carpocapsae TaxID=34508 RepID=A0A4U5MTG0_STECR|nr:hypothetical protein L596_020358 [Steinernema carpocapsae]